jgi:transcriptional regulator with XRE-family HTH domain
MGWYPPVERWVSARGHPAVVPESHASRGTRRGRRLLQDLGAELRAARLAAGLTLAQVAAAAGISAGELSRIERGLAPWLDVLTAARLCAVVGLDLWIRAFEGPDPIRDAASARMFSTLTLIIGRKLVVRAEVAIGDGRDQRAWDGVLSEPPTGESCAIELESRLSDAQRLVRRDQPQAPRRQRRTGHPVRAGHACQPPRVPGCRGGVADGIPAR